MTSEPTSTSQKNQSPGTPVNVDLALKAARLGVWELDPATGLINWDGRCRALFGLADDNFLPYEQAIRQIYTDDLERVQQAVQWAITLRSGGDFDVTYRIIRADDGQLAWLRFIGQGYFDETGAVSGFAGVAQDVTQDMQRHQLIASEERFRTLIEQAPVATCLFVGRNLKIDVANELMLSYWGKDQSVIGKPLAEAIPELSGQPFEQILNDVFATGNVYEAKAARTELAINGVLKTHYFDYTYKPLRNAAGEVYAIINMATNVTGQVLARQELEESELFSRSIFYNSPVAKVIFVGEDMVIRTINETMLELLGRDTSIVGLPFMEAMPELALTPLMDQLRHVLATGETYDQPEGKIHLVKQGTPYTGYYNYIYKALQNTAGENYGVIVTATEVTEQVVARQKIEATERTLWGAIELAELATWSLNIASGTITYSQRFMDWLGFADETKTLDDAYNPLPDDYRQSVAAAIAAVIQPGAVGVYENEHPIINRLTGQQRIIHAQAQVTYDVNGNPVTLSGTARDVTQQRQLQLALEQQVQERTEELAATNEELATTNEELTESNQLLIRSNENLQQFAYVASHDLQEPLRKIQSFGDLLKTRYADQLGDGVEHLERMQVAARRMSSLIRDLLMFSRISIQQDTTDVVALNQVVSTVMNDLDIRIRETDAVVDVDTLPLVRGDATQLEQLFQNLLSNALKFRRKDEHDRPVAPRIQVRTRVVVAAELPPTVRPTRGAPAYYQIDVTDNGIGFEEKYVDRIFQVFQRLHGKAEFAGTGIGLAICAKVAANHGGAITAYSQPGQGATFSLYLPQ